MWPFSLLFSKQDVESVDLLAPVKEKNKEKTNDKKLRKQLLKRKHQRKLRMRYRW